VVHAEGFDTQAAWLSASWDKSGCQAAYAPGCRANAWDQSVKASGAGSVRFDINSQTGEGAAGNLAVNFSDDLQTQFGANEEFWLQWRQRFDDYVISHDYRETSGNGAWKQIILAQGDRATPDGVLYGYSCSEAELVVVNISGKGYPASYLECGRYANFEEEVGGSLITRQNARGSSCIYFPSGDTSGCLRYYPNEWMTFMIHLKMGPEGTAVSSVSGESQPGFINSTYDFYVARQGGALQLAHHQEGIVIPRGQYWNASRGINPDNEEDPGYGGGWTAHDAHPQAEYGKVWLTPYYTAKDATEVTQKASIWYDEVIVSTQPIAAPGGAPAPSAPAVTLTANPTSVASGSSATLTWSSENVSSCTASGDWSGARATSGQQTVGPLTASKTYTLTCGGVARSVTITVQGGGSGGGSNQAPMTPVVSSFSGPLSPGDSVIDIAAAYSDPDGDALASADWEIALDNGFASLALSRVIPGEMFLRVSAGVLQPTQNYWTRTRHRDARGAVSEWSTAVMFTTAASAPGDSDGNGIDDASQVSGFADADGNGINDADEGICDLLDADSSGVVGFESDRGNLQCFRSFSASDLPAPPSGGMNFPFGLFSFRVDGLRADAVNPATVTVSVHLPERPSGSVKWYKLDPATAELFEFEGNVTFAGNTALVELVDGGSGDFDGVVNGVIVDPSGPLTVASSGGSGGGGGSIGILLPALMGGASLLRRRRRALRHRAMREFRASFARGAPGHRGSRRSAG
jgi:hypothetical protein